MKNGCDLPVRFVFVTDSKIFLFENCTDIVYNSFQIILPKKLTGMPATVKGNLQEFNKEAFK